MQKEGFLTDTTFDICWFSLDHTFNLIFRIIGGTLANPGAWPWAVILGQPGFSGSFQVSRVQVGQNNIPGY